MITVADLRTVPLFEDLDDEALAWLSEHCEEVRLGAGDVLTRVGSPAEWLFITLAGHIRGVFREGGREAGGFLFKPGDVGGMLPHSRLTHFPAESRAAEPSRVGRLHVRHFPEMLRRFPVLDTRLAHLMIDRTRAYTRDQLQQEKLVSLGTMAAGLAHELNNPAAAARRTAQHLRETLQAFDEHASAMLRTMMFKEPDGDGDPFQPVYDVIGSKPPALDPITRSEREDELADWLEERGAGDPWEAAPVLVSVGFTRAMLEAFAEALVEEHVVDFLNWLPRDVEMRLLADELALSTMRISDLVSAMKAYSFMDQAHEKQPVDLHRGLDNTLTILGHKLKHRQIEIVKQYGDVPPVPAHGGELNQVWTNLLDNAIAAVPEQGGRIQIKTCYDAPTGQVQVDIIDNGSGIPPEVQERIFEPFFTTKGPGEGTGLGLDIVYRIVTAHHGGTIAAASVPGETCFQVRLPVDAIVH